MDNRELLEAVKADIARAEVAIKSDLLDALGLVRVGGPAVKVPLEDADKPLSFCTADERILLDALQAGTHRVVDQELYEQIRAMVNKPATGKDECRSDATDS